MRVSNGQTAVSPVLSVLLLVLITFGAGILLYNFVMATVGNMGEAQAAQPFSLFIENVAINSTCITVYIRNSSNKTITIDRAYVDNEPRDVLPLNNKVAISRTSIEKVYLPGSYSSGALYEIKIVCASGHTLLYMKRY